MASSSSIISTLDFFKAAVQNRNLSSGHEERPERSSCNNIAEDEKVVLLLGGYKPTDATSSMADQIACTLGCGRSCEMDMGVYPVTVKDDSADPETCCRRGRGK